MRQGKIALALAGAAALAACATSPPPLASQPKPYVSPSDTVSLPPWAESGPGPDDYLEVYPPVARRQVVNSSVRLQCTIRDDRRLDCTPAWEEVPGLGFDKAALEVSRLFVMKKTDDPDLQPGKQVVLPIVFRLAPID